MKTFIRLNENARFEELAQEWVNPVHEIILPIVDDQDAPIAKPSEAKDDIHPDGKFRVPAVHIDEVEGAIEHPQRKVALLPHVLYWQICRLVKPAGSRETA